MNQIPFRNLVGFCTDGANVMRGKNNSVVGLLKNKCPNLVDIHCLSHCFNLIARKASEQLPDSVQNSITNIFAYF